MHLSSTMFMSHIAHAFVLPIQRTEPISFRVYSSGTSFRSEPVPVLPSLVPNYGTILARRRHVFTQFPSFVPSDGSASKWHLNDVSIPTNTNFGRNKDDSHRDRNEPGYTNAILRGTFHNSNPIHTDRFEVSQLDKDTCTKIESTEVSLRTPSTIRRLKSSLITISSLHQQNTSMTHMSREPQQHNTSNQNNATKTEHIQHRHVPIIALICATAIGVALCMASISTLSLFLEGRKSLIRFICHSFQSKLPARRVVHHVITVCQQLVIASILFLTVAIASLHFMSRRNEQFSFDSF